MASPVADSYSAPSGGVIAAGRFPAAFDPDNASSDWPPGVACSIPAVGGVNSPIHCKVIDAGVEWNGYRYWMAFTPYPLSNDDTVENPSVVASNDGSTWVAPATNPIEPAPSGAQTGYKYYADTHLALVGGMLYLFFILNESTGFYSGTRTTTVYVRTSTDGINWTAKQQVIQRVTTDIVDLLSPSIHFHNGKWWMWTYSSADSPLGCYLRTADSVTGPWSAAQACICVLPDATRELWHGDVMRTPRGWAMLIADRKKSDKTKGRLWLAYADGRGLTWSVRSAAFGTAPNVYRSSMVPKSGGFDCWITDWDTRQIKRLTITDSQI